MHELIVRFLQGKTTPLELQQLREWRASSLDNEREFREIEDVWHMTAHAAPDSLVGPPSADEIVRRARAHSDTARAAEGERAPLGRARIEREANGHIRLSLLREEEDADRQESGTG